MPSLTYLFVMVAMGLVSVGVIVVAFRTEMGIKRSPGKRIWTLIAVVLALAGLWAVFFPVYAPGRTYCGFTPGVLADLLAGETRPSTGAMSACDRTRWLHLGLGMLSALGAPALLWMSRRTMRP